MSRSSCNNGVPFGEGLHVWLIPGSQDAACTWPTKAPQSDHKCRHSMVAFPSFHMAKGFRASISHVRSTR